MNFDFYAFLMMGPQVMTDSRQIFVGIGRDCGCTYELMMTDIMFGLRIYGYIPSYLQKRKDLRDFYNF